MIPRFVISTLYLLAGLTVHANASDKLEFDDRALLEWLKSVQPGTGHVMIEISDRYQNLYFAAQQGNWDFAAYQVEEMEEAMERLAILKPKRKAGLEDFVETRLEGVEKAVEARDLNRFENAFEQMRAGCIACHVDNGQPHIQVRQPARPTSPVLIGEEG